jgi:hypothetical protein
MSVVTYCFPIDCFYTVMFRYPATWQNTKITYYCIGSLETGEGSGTENIKETKDL